MSESLNKRTNKTKKYITVLLKICSLKGICNTLIYLNRKTMCNNFYYLYMTITKYLVLIGKHLNTFSKN